MVHYYIATPDIITTSENLTPNNTKKCFANLPTELRFEIGNHALPPPSELRVFAKILTSSSEYGLCLVFISTQATAGKAHDRTLSLLRVNTECRNLYISKLPIVLPCGVNGMGQLRMRREDILYVWNMRHLLSKLEFRRALREKFQLQDWWTKVRHVVFYVSGLADIYPLAAVLKSLKDLRVLGPELEFVFKMSFFVGRW
jgi:hypothetical protein